MAETEDSRKQRKRITYRAWAAANREKRKEYMREWRAANRATKPARDRKWREANLEKVRALARKNYAKLCARQPSEAAYIFHRRSARTRGIAFLLTFEEWLAIWLESGKWEQRGRKRGQYVMARYGDIGPYSRANVRICEVSENIAEAMNARRGKPWSNERRERFEAMRAHRRPPLRTSNLVRPNAKG